MNVSACSHQAQAGIFIVRTSFKFLALVVLDEEDSYTLLTLNMPVTLEKFKTEIELIWLSSSLLKV